MVLEMKTSVQRSIDAFVAAVGAAWPAVTAVLGKHNESHDRSELLGDWLQTMWETLVEAPLNVAADRSVRLNEAGWYHEEPPFDGVLVWGGASDVALPLEHLDFDLGPPLGI